MTWISFLFFITYKSKSFRNDKKDKKIRTLDCTKTKSPEQWGVGFRVSFKKFLIYIKNCSQCWIPRKVMIVLREGAKKGTREFYVYCAHKMLDLRAKHGISKQVQLSKIVDWLGLEFTTRSSFKSVIYQIHQNGMYQIFIYGKKPWNYTKYKNVKINQYFVYFVVQTNDIDY